MRVTVLNPIGLVGGAERVLLAGIRATIQEFPHAAVQLLLLGDGPLRHAAEQLGATVEVTPLPAQLGQLGETQYRGASRWAALPPLLACTPALLQTIRRMRQKIRRFRPDLIHSHGVKAHLLTRWLRPRGVPVVGSIQDFLGERPLAGRLLRHLGGLTHAVAASRAVQHDLAQVCPGLPSFVVHNPVDTALFTPGEGSGAGLDHLAGLDPPSGPVLRFGLVATYANWKGHRLFLEALAQVRDLPIRGYIIGGPIYSTPGSQVSRKELVQLAFELGLSERVGFVEYQRDPLQVYRSLDVVVHASTRPEPFGLTIVEAMSCARPVIVSAAGGAAELFTEGVTAIGFEPGQAGQLAQCIRRLATDAGLRKRLQEAARDQAQQFRYERFATAFAEVYRSVLQG